VGPAGPTSVHRPEICLSSRAYVGRGERQRLTVRGPDGKAHRFWTADFQSTGVGGELLRVCYGWSTGGEWAAPDDARFAFAGSPYLYKLQASFVLHGGEGEEKETSLSQFLRDFVADAQKAIIAPPRD
ncbi:MAG: hypothetical protein ABFC96_09945, partial [Thermoguttaceae bacterium]